MRVYILIILLVVLVGRSASQEGMAKEYSWDDHPDYSELRKTIGWSDDYSSKCESGRPLSEMVNAINNEKWSESVVIGNDWLNQCPIDIRVHYYMGISLEQLGKKSESENHFRWMSGFMDDLVASGDGKTPETAYKVISISEEYDAIYFFGLKRKSQALKHGKVMSDLITAVDKNGKEVSIYFNPAAHFERLSKMFN